MVEKGNERSNDSRVRVLPGKISYLTSKSAGIVHRLAFLRASDVRLSSWTTSAEWVVPEAKLPEDLAEDAEGEIGVGSGEVQAADEAADLFLGGGGGAPFHGAAGIRFQIAAGAEGVEQERGEAIEIGGGGGDMFLRFRRGLGVAREFVETDGHGLAEVHGAMLFAGGDAQEPVAVAEVFIRKTTLF